jgi:lantibiotic modifying enzyme
VTCPIGAYEGLGSLIYLFSHIHALWHDPAQLALAEALLPILERCIEQDERLDIMGGAAGAIVSLLSLQQTSLWSQALPVALRCGEHLLRRLPARLAQHTLQPGFAYGLAGMAYSLLTLAEVSPDERLRQTALDLLARERSLFVPERRNWPRLVEQEREDFPVAWCHGASGIALARLGTLALLDDPATRSEIALALQTTCEAGFGLNHALCHGDLGNLDVLLAAQQVLGRPEDELEVARRTAQVFESIERQGWITGVPLHRETPGLLTGLAGIGYELLRLARPKLVPSVLLLAPPRPLERMEALPTGYYRSGQEGPLEGSL